MMRARSNFARLARCTGWLCEQSSEPPLFRNARHAAPGMTKRMNRPWTDDRVAELLARWSAGESRKAIAIALGVSVSAITSHAVRRDLPPRERRCGFEKSARQLAKERGEKRYFTGEKCPMGHTAGRLVSNGVCIICAAERRKKYKENRGSKNAWHAARRQRKRMGSPWGKEGVRIIYKTCALLRRALNADLEVDHIIPLMGKTVCGLHVPRNLRIIPAKENQAKHAKLLDPLPPPPTPIRGDEDGVLRVRSDGAVFLNGVRIYG